MFSFLAHVKTVASFHFYVCDESHVRFEPKKETVELCFCFQIQAKAERLTGKHTGFRAPPKSDGKSFNPFLLFRLLTRLENKDIKTWSDLVIELGVEPPDPEKNQSTQKVQQYAVRLKVSSPKP